MSLAKLGAAAICALWLPISASAATVLFTDSNVGNTGATQRTYTFMGVSNGLIVNGFRDQVARNIHARTNGIGVNNNPEEGRIAGLLAREALTFRFSASVFSTFGALTITDAGIFENGAEMEPFVFSSGDGFGGSGFLSGLTLTSATKPGLDSGTSIQNISEFATFPGVTLSDADDFFLIGGNVADGVGNRGIRVASLTAAPAIPLPAPALLLLCGLAGLAFVGRRRATG